MHMHTEGEKYTLLITCNRSSRPVSLLVSNMHVSEYTEYIWNKVQKP